MSNLRTLRLRLIALVDFRKSELTNFNEVSAPAHIRATNDCVMLVNKQGTQLVFVYGFSNVTDSREPAEGAQTHQVLHSERLRLTSGRWNPLMLANYAQRAGIELEGIRRFEEHYRQALAARATQRRQHT